MVTLNDIAAILPELEKNYKYLHQHPELGFTEQNTSQYIMAQLNSYGIQGRRIARTGIIADIHGHAPGKTLAIRADMDALPLNEESGVPYASLNPGVMHACGHDSHVTMLLGAAHYLVQHRDAFCGTVRLIFQPAEEGAAMEIFAEVEAEGGSAKGGAASMIAYGAMDGVDACVALHINSQLPVGRLEVPKERFSASSDVFELTIQGKGGHASAPENAIDPMGALAAVIAAYNALPAREISALESCSLSIGVVKAGEAWNAIPDSAYISGGLRAFSNENRDYIFRRMNEIANGICAAHRCTASFIRHEGYPPGLCNADMAEKLAQVSRAVLGNENVTVSETPMMGSEDVGYYFQKVPGVIAWLGAMPEDGQAFPMHNPHMKINLNAMRNGVLIHINMALEYLGR